MSSQLERQRTLLRTAGQLHGFLSEPLLLEPPGPIPLVECRILQRAVRRWLNLLFKITEREAKAPVQLENPYLAGDPVTGRHFFDREQILNVLRSRTETGQSLLLIGQRRSGKTSIVMELGARVTERRWDLPVRESER
jgi:hypothetical protein